MMRVVVVSAGYVHSVAVTAEGEQYCSRGGEEDMLISYRLRNIAGKNEKLSRIGIQVKLDKAGIMYQKSQDRVIRNLTS